VGHAELASTELAVPTLQVALARVAPLAQVVNTATNVESLSPITAKVHVSLVHLVDLTKPIALIALAPVLVPAKLAQHVLMPTTTSNAVLSHLLTMVGSVPPVLVALPVTIVLIVQELLPRVLVQPVLSVLLENIAPSVGTKVCPLVFVPTVRPALMDNGVRTVGLGLVLSVQGRANSVQHVESATTE
jgi:hypothetical protein